MHASEFVARPSRHHLRLRICPPPREVRPVDAAVYIQRLPLCVRGRNPLLFADLVVRVVVGVGEVVARRMSQTRPVLARKVNPKSSRQREEEHGTGGDLHCEMRLIGASEDFDVVHRLPPHVHKAALRDQLGTCDECNEARCEKRTAMLVRPLCLPRRSRRRCAPAARSNRCRE